MSLESLGGNVLTDRTDRTFSQVLDIGSHPSPYLTEREPTGTHNPTHPRLFPRKTLEYGKDVEEVETKEINTCQGVSPKGCSPSLCFLLLPSPLLPLQFYCRCGLTRTRLSMHFYPFSPMATNESSPHIYLSSSCLLIFNMTMQVQHFHTPPRQPSVNVQPYTRLPL